jgi:hypothetical protein
VTLDEMLALLPDNTTGEITPADMRAIVSGLYEAAHTTGNAYAYRWTDDQSPPTGQVTMDQPWQIFATKLLISETSDDGTALPVGLLNDAAVARVWLTTAAGSRLEADVTGPAADLGDYRDVPIGVLSVVGPGPNAGNPLTVSVVVVAG